MRGAVHGHRLLNAVSSSASLATLPPESAPRTGNSYLKLITYGMTHIPSNALSQRAKRHATHGKCQILWAQTFICCHPGNKQQNPAQRKFHHRCHALCKCTERDHLILSDQALATWLQAFRTSQPRVPQKAWGPEGSNACACPRTSFEVVARAPHQTVFIQCARHTRLHRNACTFG